jgi:uncharacterized protein YndB with AHSA1/START domain
MPRDEPIGFDHTVAIAAPPGKVIGAFFDARALGIWWGVARAIANPTVLGAYTIQWPLSETVDSLLGPLGGTFHGTIMEYQPGRTFFLAEAYWIPPRNAPVGPMSLEVTCTTRSRLRAAMDALRSKVPGADAETVPADDLPDLTTLRVVQRGYEESERWRRYYELLGTSLPAALERLKEYLEHGRGVWDLRGW